MSTKSTESRLAKLAELVGVILIFAVCIPVAAAIFYWYNYVLIRPQLGYWQHLVLVMGYIVASSILKPLRYVAGLVAATCVIVQCLAWIGLVALPLIKL